MIAIVLVGNTGSGKTTLAKHLARELGIQRIGSGDIARSLAQTDAYTKAGLERGDMAPELAMRTEVLAQIEAATATTGDFVIEGFPRKLEQLYILESVVGIQPIYFLIRIDSLTCMRRLIKRGRQDDHPDAVATRLRAYRELTLPMVQALEPAACQLDGYLSIETLVEQVIDEYQMADSTRKAA